MNLSGSLRAQSDSVCFTHEVAELISEQLANFKEVSKDYASLQQSYHSLKVENEILKSEKGESNDLKQRLKLAATSRKQWRKLRKQMIIEL